MADETQTWATSDIIKIASEWQEEGANVALARVLSVWGSAPYPVGCCMAIRDDGHFVGSVSGGCIEGAVIEEAQVLLKTGGAAIFDYGITNTQAWEVGLSCGGKISIYIEALSAEKIGLFAKCIDDISKRKPVALLTDLSTHSSFLFDPEVRALPEQFSDEEAQNILQKLEDAFSDNRSGVFEGNEGDAFLHIFNPPLKIYVIGAVHITQALVEMASLLNYEVIVVDPRMGFANAERFPTLTLDTRWPDEALEEAKLDVRSAVVTLTHDPKLDDAALHVALRSSAFYIGCLGSQKTHGARLKRLAAAGFGEQDLARIHGPVGLDIGSKSPSEIALSIIAEITKIVRRGA